MKPQPNEKDRELQAWIQDATADLVRRARKRLAEEYTDHYHETYDAMTDQGHSEDDSHRAAMDRLGDTRTVNLASLKLHGDPLRIRFKLAVACIGLLAISAAWYTTEKWSPRDFHSYDSSIYLHNAIASGHLDQVIGTTNNIDSLETTDLEGHTPLYQSLRSIHGCPNSQSVQSRMEITLFLLEQGADWKTPYENEEPFIFQAASMGLERVVAWLLKHGEPLTPEVAILLGRTDRLAEQLDRDPELANKVVLPTSGLQLLHVAAQAHDTQTIEILLDRGANPNAKSKLGFTPLHLAALYAMHCRASHELQQQVHNVGLLIEHGADVNAQTDGGIQPIGLAMRWEDIEILQYLVDNGADVTSPEDSRYPSIIMVRTVEQLDFLIAHGANVDAQDSEGNTLLHSLGRNFNYLANITLIKRALEFGANPNIKNDEGRTPLHGFAYSVFLDIEIPYIGNLYRHTLQQLLEHGADTSIRDDIGETAYSLTLGITEFERNHPLAQHPMTPVEAIKLGDIDVLKQHLEISNQDQKNNWLSHAVVSRQLDMIQMLLEEGADPNDYDAERSKNVRRSNYHAPLRFAVGTGNLELVRLLLEFSANPNQRVEDKYGYDTPLHLAAVGERTELANILLESGADIHAKDTQGRTPLDIANELGSPLTQDLFREYLEGN